MTGNTTAESVETRRKRLKFRSWHRGTRELDLLVGRFADQHLGTFSDRQLELFEELLECSDPDIYNWLTGREPLPKAMDHDVMKLLKNYTLAVRKN